MKNLTKDEHNQSSLIENREFFFQFLKKGSGKLPFLPLYYILGAKNTFSVNFIQN